MSNTYTTEEKYMKTVAGIKDFAEAAGFKSVLLGVSGGIDSALVAALAADALGPENVYGIAMPSRHSSAHSLLDAEELMRNLDANYQVVPIETMVQSFNLLKLTDAAAENIQSRIRGVVLMGISNRDGHMVLSTGNKSEVLTGYCTMYGDTVGGLAPLAHLYKTEVYDLARWRNTQGLVIPENTLEKPPSAELSPNQQDSDSLPPYEILDSLLFKLVEENRTPAELQEEFGEDLVERIAKLHRSSEWKRAQMAPSLKL